MKERIYLSSPHMSEEGYEQAYIQEAFDKNWIAPLGFNVDGFEEELSEMVGIDHALALASGTAAIHLALKLAGVGEGDVVLCQSLTFSASANPILYEKATPVFIDSETDGWNIDPGYLEEASRLVMQAGALARGGEIFVLDMGEPVKIAELARQMIWLSGHTEDEIEIVESGIRPGEKLYEELLADDENTEEQIFEKIFVGKAHNLPIQQVNAFINALEDLSTDELKETLVQFANNTHEENQEVIEELVNMQYQN